MIIHNGKEYYRILYFNDFSYQDLNCSLISHRVVLKQSKTTPNLCIMPNWEDMHGIMTVKFILRGFCEAYLLALGPSTSVWA